MVLLFGVLSALSSHAAGYACKGKVSVVTVDLNGLVTANFNFEGGEMGWQYICNLNEPYVGIQPGSCKGLLAVLTAANLSGKNVQVWFDNATGSSCKATAWRPLKDMGWYWGPALMD